MSLGRGPTRRFVLVSLLLVSIYMFYTRYTFPSRASYTPIPNVLVQKPVNEISKVIVTVTTKYRLPETTWLQDELSAWPSILYVADDPDAPYHPRLNKGNEASSYLTYIIDHYDSLPDVIIFTHYHNEAIHIDKALGTNANTIRRLNLTHVLARGYQSLRCQREIHCTYHSREYWTRTYDRYREAWNHAFAPEPCPEVVVAPCCAQFAVSRQAVHGRSREAYERLLDWLTETEIHNMWSGRIFEYMWHIIFGKPAMYCVDQDPCYCAAYGLCDYDPNRGWHPKPGDPGFADAPINETINEWR